MRWPWTKRKTNALADELRRVADTVDRLYPNTQAVAVCLSMSEGGGSYYTFEEPRTNGEVVAALLKMRAQGAALQVVKVNKTIPEQLRHMADHIEQTKPNTRAFAIVVVEDADRAAWAGSVQEGETPASMLTLLHRHPTFGGGR